MLRWLRPRRPPPHAVPNPARADPQPGPAAADTEALLRRLEWTVLRRLDGVLQGDVRTLMRGSGLDLAALEFGFRERGNGNRDLLEVLLATLRGDGDFLKAGQSRRWTRGLSDDCCGREGGEDAERATGEQLS